MMSESSLTQREFVDTVLDIYVSLPNTPNRARRDDRYLAMKWYRQRIPLFQLQAAMLLATARRRFRDPKVGSLEPIRSIRYFVPLLEEIQRSGINESYVRYLQQMLNSVLEETASAEPVAVYSSTKAF